MADFTLDQQKAIAMASARARMAGAGGTAAAPTMGPKDVPDSVPEAQRQPFTPEPSALDLVRGVPGALLATGAGVLGGGAARAVGVVDPEAGLNLAEKFTYEPSDRAKATLDYFSKLAANTGADKLQGLGPMFAPEMAASPVGKAALRGSAARTAETATETAKKAAGKVADVVTPTPAPEVARLAKKAEDMGIELRPDMLSNNRIAKMIGEALEQVPLSGSKAEKRQMAFNGALAKIIGAEGKVNRLTPDVYSRAMDKAGKTIGDISKETPIRVDETLRNVFINLAQEAEKFETADIARVVKNYVQELGRLTGPDGVIPGESFRKINSKIGAQMRGTSIGDLKNALGKVQDAMHDALEAQIASPEKLTELQEARFKYRMGKIIEPLVAKAVGGDISPQALMSAVTSDASKKAMMAHGKGGDIGDLARIGQAFLKEPPSSGTGERLGAYAILRSILTGSAGGAALAEPITSAGVVATTLGTANLYNRLGPALTKRAINRRAIDPVEKQPWSDTGILTKLSP